MERMGQVNRYYCKGCGKSTFTINLNNGVTPFGIICPLCDHLECYSCFYTLATSKVTVTHCFYRPMLVEYKKLDFDVKSHVAMGGLLFGLLTDAKPLWPDEFTSDGQAALKLLEKIYDVRN